MTRQPTSNSGPVQPIVRPSYTQHFRITHAPEALPLTSDDVRRMLWRSRPDTQWDVWEVWPSGKIKPQNTGGCEAATVRQQS